MKSNSNDYLNNLRHSCAHLLAHAVKQLYSGALNAIGPAIENGFYQDFDIGKWKLSEEDLPKIEAKMREILPSWQKFTFNEVTIAEAKSLFKDNKYKVDMATEFAKEGKKLMTNDPGDFLDLCKMGHVENPSKEIRYFKLLSVAGAYWRGNEKNKMLTRIYGTCWPTKGELERYLWQIEEAKKRDHRKIGRDLDLFIVSQEIGGGFPIFTPKGTMLRNAISDYIIAEKQKRGYQFVWTPHIAHSNIYKKSGHWQKYDAMFNPMKLDDEDYVLKPMNCPHHFQIYLDRPRSYRELPFRIAENGTCYRYEKSGVLNGLLRVRSVTIDDTHTFIRYQNTFDEINRVLQLVLEVFKTFGFTDYKARISVRDPANPNKFLGDSQHWDRAEEALKRGAKHLDIPYEIGEGEAAFYGPKIDMMVKDSLGRQWQLSTIQLDYNQPENFDMTYIDEHGQKQRPAILHIAVLGSIERFMGVLIEHLAGAFPLWLAPVQVMLIPIAERHIQAAQKVRDVLIGRGLRVEVDDRNETMQAKIRATTLQKVPYMGIMGDTEATTNELSVRTRSGQDLKSMSLEQFVARLTEEIEHKS